LEIIWLGEPASMNAAIVGGKAAALGRLSTRYRVPPGFCVHWESLDSSDEEWSALWTELLAYGPYHFNADTANMNKHPVIRISKIYNHNRMTVVYTTIVIRRIHLISKGIKNFSFQVRIFNPFIA
jgi:hypothetical protein